MQCPKYYVKFRLRYSLKEGIDIDIDVLIVAMNERGFLPDIGGESFILKDQD